MKSKKSGDQKAQQQKNQEAAAKEKALLDDFKKAFSVCMEGKGYSVKQQELTMPGVILQIL